MTSPSRATRTWLLAMAVVGLALAAYFPSLPGGWIYDDNPLIAHNPHAHSLSEWSWWLTHDFWYTDAETVLLADHVIYWRPLVSASYALDWTLGGGEPLMFHVTNLLAQAVVAALSYSVLRRWISHPLAAALAAALFVVHPTKAESVAWISGRTDVFCMIAVLVATIGIGRRLRGERGGIALEIAGTIAAYLCKEQAIVLPAFVLLELWIARGRPPIDLAFVKSAVRVVAPQTIFAFAYLATRALVMPMRTTKGSLAIGDHALAVFDSLGRYLELTFAPVELSIQQGLVYSVTRPEHSLVHVVLGIAGVLVFGALAWAGRRRWPAVTMGIVFFAVTLSPTANIIYSGMNTLVSERFLYLPMFGVAFLLGDLVARLPAPRARVVAGLVGLATALFTVRSMQRSADYVDEERFWRHELAVNPESREARGYIVESAIRARHYPTALRELLELSTRVKQFALGFTIPRQIAEVTSQLVPDLATSELRAIDAFATQVLARDRPTATLAVRGVTLSVELDNRFMTKRIEQSALRLWTLRALIASRLGEHTRATELVNNAMVICTTCLSTITTRALVLARAGQIDEGIAVLERGRGVASDVTLDQVKAKLVLAREQRDLSLTLEGPAALQAHASQLMALELWGAAYEVLAPYKDELAEAPRAALGFAELAYRAGAEEVAREVLARNVAPGEIETQLAAWAETMGWAP